MAAAVTFRARNNEDWTAAYTWLAEPGTVAPWRNVPAYAAGPYRASAPQSTVRYGGDLYVATPGVLPAEWTAGDVFEPARWTKVAALAAYAPVPYDLTGCELRMGVDTGEQSTMTLSTANGLLVIEDAPAGQWRFAVPTARARTLAAGSYPFDYLILKAGRRLTALTGTLVVSAGITP